MHLSNSTKQADAVSSLFFKSILEPRSVSMRRYGFLCRDSHAIPALTAGQQLVADDCQC